MKKINLLTMACAAIILSCCSIPKNITDAFTNCYAGTYTGIDTLINNDGCYKNLIFYDNGIVISTVDHLWKADNPKYNTIMDEDLEYPYSKKAENFYKHADCGVYKICGDTIKVQMISIYNPHTGWDISEVLTCKIIDKNTLRILERYRLTTKKEIVEISKKNFNDRFPHSLPLLSFKPLSYKPKFENFWVLKEKWFWCDEQDWANYMKYAEQLKKRYKENR